MSHFLIMSDQSPIFLLSVFFKMQSLRSTCSLFIRKPVTMLRCMSSSAGGKLTTVEVNDKTGIATLTMNRPPVNGLNLELLRDIHDSIDEIESNKCRGLILTSVRCSEKGVYYDIF